MMPEQMQLADLMSEISQDCYYAGWIDGLEYRLWRAVTDVADDLIYGAAKITPEQVSQMRKLSDSLGGWIICGDDGERFIQMPEWLEMYKSSAK